MKASNVTTAFSTKMRIGKRVSLCALILSFVLTASSTCWLSSMADNQRLINVMTRNMDEGTDLDFVLNAATFDDLLNAAADTYLEVAASNIPERSAGIAREIQSSLPDFVGLQEVTLWRTGPLGGPATETAFDPLQSLIDELDRLGLHYSPAAVITDFDFELPSSLGIDVRRTDRDVLLARTDLDTSQLKVLNVFAQHFDTTLPIDSPLLGHLEVPSGWISVEAKIRGIEYRVITTHLDSLVPLVRLGQASELAQALANSELPVVLIGDFNSDAESSDPDQNGAYRLLRGSGFLDAWSTAHPGDPGFTWPLHDEDPFIPFSTPNQRIDLVLFRGLEEVVSVDLIGNTLNDLTPSGLWPSDHAGIAATLQVGRPACLEE